MPFTYYGQILKLYLTFSESNILSWLHYTGTSIFILTCFYLSYFDFHFVLGFIVIGFLQLLQFAVFSNAISDINYPICFFRSIYFICNLVESFKDHRLMPSFPTSKVNQKQLSFSDLLKTNRFLSSSKRLVFFSNWHSFSVFKQSVIN